MAKDVNVVSINAPFPEEWRSELYKFANDFQDLRKSVDVLSTNIEQSVEATNKLSEYYSEGREGSGSRSAQASVPRLYDAAAKGELAGDIPYDATGQPLSKVSSGASTPTEQMP